MIDFLSFIRSESEQFNKVMAAVKAQGAEVFAKTPVPSCGDWTAADLTWHLAEVQYFWGSIVEGNLKDYSDVVPLERPSDVDLVSLHAEQAARLAALLAGREPSDSCWSWHAQGKNIGWVLRRQAHEALIHRVDAELTAQSLDAHERTPQDESLSADGVDEMLSVMLDIGELPARLHFEPSSSTVRLIADARRWNLTIGRVVGASADGAAVDQAAVDISRPVDTPSVTIDAKASELNLWLWRRDSLPEAAVVGDQAVVGALYELAAIE